MKDILIEITILDFVRNILDCIRIARPSGLAVAKGALAAQSLTSMWKTSTCDALRTCGTGVASGLGCCKYFREAFISSDRRTTSGFATSQIAVAKQEENEMKVVSAGALEIAYNEAGPADGLPVVLSHGFPYDVHAYKSDLCI